MDSEEVRKLGPYIVKETLGEGGFSKVKLGVHEKTGEKVALKILKSKAKMSSAIQKQVEREVTAMKKLTHANILAMKEVDWDATYKKKSGKEVKIILVVLELATGGELFEFLSYSGFFEESVARTYFHQLIAGVEFCHSQGVAHRDLKPENLLLNSEFTLKIADFGFSNIVSAASKVMYTECGTPGYMAPEMSKNKGYDGPAADIWSCGVILFIMLAGFPPFQKPNNSDWWFNKLATGKHALFWQAHSRSAYFSEQTKDFINKILNPDPTKRITIADIKKHPWWKGATVTGAALFAELQRRKSTVDTIKEREKENKRKEQQKTDGDGDVVMRGGGDDDFFDLKWRGEEGEEGGHAAPVSAEHDDVLPISPPKLTFKNYVFKAKAAEEDKEAGAESEKKEKAAPKELPEAVRYTRFQSDTTPQKIIERVIEVVVAGGGKYDENKSLFKVKAAFAKPNLLSRCSEMSLKRML